jgi:hypothetical protein
MSTELSTQHQDRLQAVSDAFAEWRRSRQKRSPIPEEFRHAATALSPLYSTLQISRALRLDYAKLKRRIDESAPCEKSPSFIELKAESLFAVARCSIQLQSPEGFQMEIRAEVASPSEFVPLITAFLGKSR